MKEEIKEIIEELDKFPYGKFYGLRQEQANQIKQLLNYITSLQKENEKLKKRNKEIYDGFMTTIQEVRDTTKENEELQQRIDKAIDYLEQPPVIEINGEFRNIYSEDDDKLLKILKGE